MIKEKTTFKSDFDGLEISCLTFVPDRQPKKIVQLVHGMTEYKERYEEFMEYLCDKGYIVAIHDHRGHGKSVKDKADLGYMYDKTGVAIVNDAYQFTKILKEKYPNLPVVLFGHSMGSLVVRSYLREHDDEIEKLIVCGAPYENPMTGMGLALVKSIELFKGDRYRSKMIANLSTGNNDKNFPGEGKNAWLNRTREIVEEYNKDEYCNYIFTCNGFENLFRLMKSTYDKKGYQTKNKPLPIFFVAGSNDPVIGSADKWLDAQNFLRERGYENVSGKLYHEMRHEVLKENGKEEVFDDIAKFIEKI